MNKQAEEILESCPSLRRISEQLSGYPVIPSTLTALPQLAHIPQECWRQKCQQFTWNFTMVQNQRNKNNARIIYPRGCSLHQDELKAVSVMRQRLCCFPCCHPHALPLAGNTWIDQAEEAASQIIQHRWFTGWSTGRETQLGFVNKYQVAIIPCWKHSPKLVVLLIHTKSKHISLRLFEIRDATGLKWKTNQGQRVLCALKIEDIVPKKDGLSKMSKDYYSPLDHI